MKSLFTTLLVLFSTQALADTKPKDGPNCHWIKVCTPKKKKAIVAVPVPAPIVVEKEVLVPRLCPPAGPFFLFPFKPYCPDHKNFLIGGHLSLGLSPQAPWTSGRIGLRLEFPRAYLGLDVGSLFQYGVYSNLLIYVYRGDRVRLSVINPGFLITGHPFDYISDSDIKRRVDLQVGVGAEVKLACHLDLIADWRASIPDPGKLSACNGNCVSGRSLSASRAVGNAFAEGTFYVGLMVK